MAKANVVEMSNRSVRVAFTLEKEPKSSGGVRYKADSVENFTVYIPQETLAGIPKGDGRFPKRLVLTIEN